MASRIRKVRVFDVDLGNTLVAAAGKAGVSRAAEQRIARRVRAELKDVLNKVVEDAFDDAEGFGIRSRSAYNIMRHGGVRVFGSTFNSVRGHIIGPSYIRLQEEGGTIHPRNAEKLAIPLPPALRPDGTPKLPGPRAWQSRVTTFIYKSKRNQNSYIARRNTSGGITLLYVLVDQATFRRKGILAQLWNQEKEAVILLFGRALVQELSKVNLFQLARITTGGRRRRR